MALFNRHYWEPPTVLDYEYNHDSRTQSPRLFAARLQLAVGRRGLGPRDQEEHRSFVATYHTRVHTAAAAVGHRAGLECLVEKNPTLSAWARLFAASLESVSAGLEA